MQHEREILPLTGLRFVAALYVFLFHFHIRWPLAGHDFVASVLSQGAVGMTIFFMLSGYILAYRYDLAEVPLRDYALNRFARIYPVYVVAGLLTLPWIGVSLGGVGARDAFFGFAQLCALVVANVLLLQAWFPQMLGYWNISASWSISTEAFFYLLFPLLLKHIRPLPIVRLSGLIAIAYVLSVLPGFVSVAFWQSGRPANYIYYSMPIFRLAEFVLGICAYFVVGHAYRLLGARLNKMAYAVIAISIVYLGLVGPRLPYWVTHNWLIVPAVFLTLLVLSRPDSIASRVMASTPMVWGGKVSYCFYSFQALIVLWLISHHDALVRALPLLADNRLVLIVAGLILIAMSALGYYFIEEPSRAAIRRCTRGSGPLGGPQPRASTLKVEEQV
jgi:peptidoglycan/LPS O-acetylase OafA/YrhL